MRSLSLCWLHLLGNRFVPPLLLKLNLFGRNCLSDSSPRLVVTLVLRSVFGPLVLGLRKLIVDVHVHLLLGVGVIVEGLIDRILKVVFLLSLEEIEKGFIFCSDVAVQAGLTRGFTHKINGIILLFKKIKQYQVGVPSSPLF